MRPIRSVSVLMPTWQGMEFLDRVLHALSTQRVDVSWDFRAIDSGSTDGTWELLGEWAERFPVPLHRERIHQVEFDHGDTRNLLAARSRGDLLVFLTQDAIPASDDWLATLLANFEDDAVGAAYCRNAPRPDALVTTQVLSAGDPGYALEPRRVEMPEPDVYEAMSAHERRLLYNFNDVASAVRRELWERHPFPRAAFGEDVLMARALLEAGSVVVYDAEAVVEHSHDYDEQETYSRAFTDGRFNAEWLDRICVGSERDAEALVEQLSRDDAKSVGAAATELGLDPQRERALLEAVGRLRRAAFLGLCAGGRSARRHEPTRLREDGCLSLLYVVHGFPPDTWAGTEVYTLNIAREMAGRGHEVTILDAFRWGVKPILYFAADKRCRIVTGDVRDAELVRREVPKHDWVLHLAAIVGYPACASDPVSARTINVDGTRNICEALGEGQQLVFASTGSTYGKVTEVCTEETPINPLTLYGSTKAEAEALAVEKFMKRYYRAVMELDRLNEMLIELFQEAILHADAPREVVSINRRFQAVNGFLISFAEAVAIVVVILTIGMGLRLSIIIGMALVATILGTFMLMAIFGIDLQRMSLCALIIALGMMVDNAIVVADGFVLVANFLALRLLCFLLASHAINSLNYFLFLLSFLLDAINHV